MNHLGRRWHGDRHGVFHLLTAEPLEFVAVVVAIIVIFIVTSTNDSAAPRGNERKVAGARVETATGVRSVRAEGTRAFTARAVASFAIGANRTVILR